MNLNIPNKIGGIPTLPLAMICLVLIAAGVAFATFTSHPDTQMGISGQEDGMSDEEIQQTLENENITQSDETNDEDLTGSEDGMTELTGTYLKKLYGYSTKNVAASSNYNVQPTTTDNPINPPVQPQITPDTTPTEESQPETEEIPSNNSTSPNNNLTEDDEGYYEEGEWDPFEDPIEPENPDAEYEEDEEGTAIGE